MNVENDHLNSKVDDSFHYRLLVLNKEHEGSSFFFNFGYELFTNAMEIIASHKSIKVSKFFIEM